MSARLRMMYSSNIMGCPSGYGVQGASLLPRLAELPEFGGEKGSPAGRANINHHAWYGLHGLTMNINGFQTYPAFDDPYGNDVIGAHMRHARCNWLVSLIDVWVMHQTAQKIAPALWTPWLPIDHDPVPQRFLDSLAGAYLPITYSKWGHDMLTKAGVENHYIPHGIEPTVYKVFPDREPARQFRRELTGSDDTFLIVMVAANKGFPDRKWMQGQLEAVRDFAKDKPNVRLYIHSDPTVVHGGIDFNALIMQLGLKGKVYFPDRYEYRLGYPPEFLALVYNAADLLISCSMSEGFGIPIIEAQACGTPVLVTNFSAMPELVRWGYKVDVADMMWTAMNSYQAWPSKADMLDKLNRMYDAWLVCGGEWPDEARRKAMQAIHDEYDWDAIVRDQWAPLVSRMAEAAPPLKAPFQARGVDVPSCETDETAQFVEIVNQELSRGKPKRRVAPLAPVTVHSNGYEAVSNEEVAL